jgi:hypothetical protein
MTPRPRSLVALGALLVLSSPADAGNPGPKARQELLGLGLCEGGGAQAGQLCVDASDCDDGSGAPGRCTTPIADVAVRGVLTLISDKDSGHWDDVSTVPEVKDDKGNVVPTDFTRSTLTVALEFTHDGRRFVLAETYQDLGDHSNPTLKIECKGFCVPGWRDPAVENRIATPSEETSEGTGGGTGEGGGQSSSPGIRISWATPPPALGAALVRALALPPGATPFLEVVNTTAIFDHSAEQDPLASVRRLKVTIRALAAQPAPAGAEAGQ